MQDNSLPPSLGHLLINEDISTGEISKSGYSSSSISPGSSSSALGLSDVGRGPIPAISDGSSAQNSINRRYRHNGGKKQLPSSRNSSPTISPTTISFPSPNNQKRPSPINIQPNDRLSLPSSAANPSIIPTSNIFQLLNGQSVTSPTSSTSSDGSTTIRKEEKGKSRERERERQNTKEERKPTPPYSRSIQTPNSAPTIIPSFGSGSGSGSSFGLPPISPRDGQLYSYSAPYTAPIITHRQSAYFDPIPSSSSPFPKSQNGQGQYGLPPRSSTSSYGSGNGELDESRPSILRRHSSHPYEYSHSSQNSIRPTTAYATTPIYEVDYVGMGARAPISRTTKACNACRGRKVRCDASGGESGPCTRCIESGTACIYTGTQKKRGPCPGTARPSISKPRRPSTQSQISSHRSSIASTQSVQSYVVTPTDEQAPWGSRSSYGFPPPPTPSSFSFNHPDPSEWSSIAPSKGRPNSALVSNTNTNPNTNIGGRNSINGPNLSTTVLNLSNNEPKLEFINRTSIGSNRPGPRSGPSMFDQNYKLESNDTRPGSSEDLISSNPNSSSNSYSKEEFRALPPLRLAIDRDHNVG